ncbi:MAG: hypothetical protein ACTSPE_09750 [Candidatus Thorarchaeota archaeon]
MALSGEKVGIPEADEAPVVVLPRWKQPVAGLVSLVITFVVTILVWLVPGMSIMGSLLGGFGLMSVLFSIWFENWPFYDKLRTPWKVGLASTIVNIVVAFLFFFLASFFGVFYGSAIGISDTTTAVAVGWAIFGALSASCFSFAVLWLAGTMYWPWFDRKQPGRGVRVFILGWIITLVAWFLLFYSYGNPSATLADPLTWVLPQYGINMAWTQWIIFFSLLTLMVFEYAPWSRAGRQPIIGIVAFVGCVILGFVWVFVAGIVGFMVTLPIFLMFYPAPAPGAEVLAVGVWNIVYADWLIAAVIVVALFFDNWPKGYSQKVNLFIRLVTVVILGTIFFFGFYLIAPFIGFSGDPFTDNPTAFMLVLLWVELVFAYLWRKWPVYTTME